MHPASLHPSMFDATMTFDAAAMAAAASLAALTETHTHAHSLSHSLTDTQAHSQSQTQPHTQTHKALSSSVSTAGPAVSVSAPLSHTHALTETEAEGVPLCVPVSRPTPTPSTTITQYKRSVAQNARLAQQKGTQNKRGLAVFGLGRSSATEEGEETSTLPYVRVSKRFRTQHSTANSSSSSVNAGTQSQIETMAIREVDPERLLATKRIVNAFNAGDVEAIRDIIQDSSTELCEVFFSNLQHVFVGQGALFSLWSSLFEAFPNGIFRTSDSVINEKKQVFTSFLFFGTKIFPLLIDGMPLELIASDKSLSAEQLLQTASIKVDRNQPIFTTAELLEAENIPEMVFEGRIVLHMNEHCKIRKFDFAWNRKM